MESVNTQIFYFFNQFAGQSSTADRVIVFFADYLAYILVIVFLIWLVRKGITKSEKTKIFLSALVSGVLGRGFAVEIIRYFYNHPRPFVTLSGVHQLFAETGYSLPSGHATLFFGLSAVIYHYDKKAGQAFLVLSSIMGIARIMAGVHYPLDIIAGAIIGTLIGYWSCLFVEKYIPRNN